MNRLSLSKSCCQPLIPATVNLPELTFKVIVLSIVLAAILAASNAYLALKIGSTISASIPASVLAMGTLRFFKQSNVLESNIIQTAASAGEGVAAATAFVLPAMIVLQVWQTFPYWETVSVTVIGGLLGVIFSIPLRRVFLNMPSLPFPEGTAVGNVLRASTEKGQSLRLLAQGAGVGALLSFAQSGFKVIAESVQYWFVSGRALYGMALGFEPALFAAGFIVGAQVGISMLIGLLMGWILIPLITLIHGLPHAATPYLSFSRIWHEQLRYVGVGMMLLGGIWTLLSLFKPLVQGMKLSFQGLNRSKGGKITLQRTDRDIPLPWVIGGLILLSSCLFLLLLHTENGHHLAYSRGYLLGSTLFSLGLILTISFVLASICGYFGGLIGATNNPVSGILIIAVLMLGGMYLLFFHQAIVSEQTKIAALIIIVATVVATISTIALENLQDLKAGQIVGATPWKQQLILAVGVIVAALVIAPILNLLFNAYGIGGIFPHAGMDPQQMLAAPQAVLLATIAKGVLAHQLNWSMILLGVAIAAIVIAVDHQLQKRDHRLLVLAVGLGVYLPPQTVVAIVAGALVSHWVKASHKKHKLTIEEQPSYTNGILLACGIVAGSALMGVFLAVPFAVLGSTNALSLGFTHTSITVVLGLISSVLLCGWLYRTAASRLRG